MWWSSRAYALNCVLFEASICAPIRYRSRKLTREIVQAEMRRRRGRMCPPDELLSDIRRVRCNPVTRTRERDQVLPRRRCAVQVWWYAAEVGAIGGCQE